MKRKNRLQKGILVFLIIFFNGNTFAQESFYVYFMQNGKRINVKESKIELKKMPFEIYTEYTAPLDLLVHASLDSKTWHAAEKGKLIYEIPVFNENKKKRPSIFDFDGTLIVNPDQCFLWEKNQSDTVADLKSKKGRKINIKKVKNLYSVKDSTALYPQNYEKKLYLIFIYTVNDKDGERIEIQREIIKINWVNKYKEETKSYKHKKKVSAKDKVRYAEQNLKRKQKTMKKEEERLKKLEKDKEKRLAKQKMKAEKEESKKTEKEKKSSKK